MQKTTADNTTKNRPMFKRKAALGFEPMSCDENKPNVFVQIMSTEVSTFTKKDGDTIPYVDVVDMESGLEHRLWLSGQLNYQLNNYAATKGGLKGLSIEIEYKGQKPMEIDGEKTKVNQYRIYEIDPN